MAKIIHWYKHRTKKKTKDDDNAVSIKTIHILVSRRVYLGLSILKVSETEFYEFWYDCVNPIYGEKHNYATWIQRTL